MKEFLKAFGMAALLPVALVALSGQAFLGTSLDNAFSVSNNWQLQNLISPPSPGYLITRQGFASAGDAAPLAYRFSSTACPAADNGAQVAPAAATGLTGCYLAQVPASGLDGAEYGVTTTAADNSAGLQAWLNQACTYPLTLGKGVFKFKAAPLIAPACNGGKVTGSGWYATWLEYTGTSTTPDLVDVGAATNAGPFVRGWTVRDIGVESATTMTAGTGLHLLALGETSFKGVNVGGEHADFPTTTYNGIWCDNCVNTFYDTFEASAINDGLRASGNASGAHQTGLTYSNGIIVGSGVGVHLGGDTGADNPVAMEIVANGTNVLIDHALVARGNLASIFDSATAIDSASTGDNVLINDSLFLTNQVMIFNGTWDCSAQGNGLYIQTINGQKVVANFGALCNNHLNGIRIDDASATVSDNNGAGIYINGSYGINATVVNTNIYLAGLPLGNIAGPWSVDAYLGSLTCVTGGSCYTKDFAGNLHQWGVINFTGAANTLLSQTWTYPIAFPNFAQEDTLSCTPFGFSNAAAQMTIGPASPPATSSAVIVLVSSTTVTTSQPVICSIWGK